MTSLLRRAMSAVAASSMVVAFMIRGAAVRQDVLGGGGCALCASRLAAASLTARRVRTSLEQKAGLTLPFGGSHGGHDKTRFHCDKCGGGGRCGCGRARARSKSARAAAAGASTRRAKSASATTRSGAGLPAPAHRRRRLNSSFELLRRGRPSIRSPSSRASSAASAPTCATPTAAQSSGPLEIDRPWDAYTDDHIGLMDHLGIDKFMVLGFCIGGPFIWNLLERAPNRVVAAVLAQPSGFRPEHAEPLLRQQHEGLGRRAGQAPARVTKEHGRDSS